METTNHAIRNKVPWRRLHINLHTQLTTEKRVLNLKLRHRPMVKRCHNKESMNNGHVGNMGECIIKITILLQLRTTSHKTSFVALKRTIRASLMFLDPLDGTNTKRGRDQIPRASALASTNLLGHGKIPFEVALRI
jgi:hypothetical protein